MTNTPALSRLWWAAAIGGGAAVVAIAVLPVDSLARSFVARGVGVASVALFLLAFKRLPIDVRRIWAWVGAYLALTVIADVIFDYQALVLNVRPFPGITDIFYLVAFACAITGLLKLSRRLNPHTDLPSWIDISIMVLAASAFIGVFVISSVWDVNDGMLVSTALDLLYPLLSLVLLTALIRLFILPHPKNMAIRLLVVSGVCFLLCDLIFSNQLIVGRTPVVAIEVLWAIALLCLPLAIMSPGAALFVPVDDARANEVTPTRQVLIIVSAIAVPTIVLLELVLTGTIVANWLLPLVVVLLALVLLRLHLLMRTSQRQALILAELGRTDSLTGLPSRATWDQLIQQQASRTAHGAGVCTIAMLDIDNLAQHRDSEVKQHGDLLLIAASLAWLSELGSGDVLARYGQDAFALMIIRDSVPEAQEVLRRVLRATPESLSVSVGAALVRPDEDPALAVKRAKSALHAAMVEGRTDADEAQNITG